MITQEERQQVSDAALTSYYKAIANRKAHCGRLTQIMDVLRRVVENHRKNTTKVKVLNDTEPPVFDDGTPQGFTLPSHKELVEAFVECQGAKDEEELKYADALNAGVDPTVLPEPRAEIRTPRQPPPLL